MNNNLDTLTWDNLLDHADEKSCYIIMKELVYDVTSLISSSTAYREILLKNAAIKNCEEQIKLQDESLYNQVINEKNIVGKIENKPQSEYFKRKLRFLKAEFESFTMEEVQKHNKIQDLWVVLDDNVYDFTEYQFIHPGRPDTIHPYAGKDATEKFNSITKHTDGARRFRENYKIGALKKQNMNDS